MSFSRNMRLVACSWIIAFIAPLAWGQHTSLRNPRTPCGLYFTDHARTQGQKIADLDLESINSALAKLDPADPQQRLALVGVPPEAARSMQQTVKNTLSDLGFTNVSVDVIRRLSAFIASEVGLYAKSTAGEWEKIGSSDPESIVTALAELGETDQREFMVVGVPYFGAKSKQISQVFAERGLESPAIVSPWGAYASKAWREPVSASLHALQSLRFLFPIREDFVPPTAGEAQAALQKIMVPGLLTFSVMLTQNQPLAVLIPVTLMNATNSLATGTYRSFLNNWLRRSTSFFPNQWLKQMALGSFFTTTLYWAGRGSVAKLSEILSIAGWQNLVTGKWLTVAFNSIWRTPIANAIVRWEEHQAATSTPMEAVEIRQAGSAIEKYLSYIMTQFFIYSIVSQESLFNVVHSSQGLEFRSPDLAIQDADQLLLSANFGHVAMAAIGALAFVSMKNTRLLNKLAGFALTLDKIETHAINTLFPTWWWFKKKSPTAERSETDTSN